jgi:hypothetical protein
MFDNLVWEFLAKIVLLRFVYIVVACRDQELEDSLPLPWIFGKLV